MGLYLQVAGGPFTLPNAPPIDRPFWRAAGGGGGGALESRKIAAVRFYPFGYGEPLRRMRFRVPTRRASGPVCRRGRWRFA